ncbi:hypothetical protein LL754_001809, partial [Campylobacter upsaliensis]|nr:hypothetical protein [Campylobacter upsaliensis]
TALSCTLLTTLLTSASAARDINAGNHNAFAINGETVTIKSGATVNSGKPQVNGYNANGSSIAVGQNGKESSITIEEGGKLNGRIYTRAAKIKDIIINGSIGAGPSNASIINFRGTTIEKIEVGQTGVLEGGIINSWFKNGGTASGNSKINNIDIKGEVKGGIKNQSGTMQTITITGSVSGGIQNDDTMNTLKIENGGSVSGDIINNKTMQSISVSNGTVNGNIVNSGSNASTGAINITGTSDIKGSIVNQNGANFNNQITLDQGSKLGGISNAANSTMSGQLTLNGEVGAINNAGKFDSTLTLSNKVGQINNEESGTISNDITINNGGSVGAINNAGTMQAITNNGTTGTLTLTNSGGTIDKITNGTGATATIRNQGKITNGIINDGGTLTVFNDFRKDESAANGYHTVGEIGKTANGVHIENNNGGKLHLNAWYFNKEDFTTQEERKNNALLVDGDYAGITLGDVFVNTQGLDVDKT